MEKTLTLKTISNNAEIEVTINFTPISFYAKALGVSCSVQITDGKKVIYFSSNAPSTPILEEELQALLACQYLTKGHNYIRM